MLTKGQVREGEEALERLAEKHPKDSTVYTLFLGCLMASGQYRRVIEKYRAFQGTFSRRVDLDVSLVRAYWEVGLLALAWQMLQGLDDAELTAPVRSRFAQDRPELANELRYQMAERGLNERFDLALKLDEADELILVGEFGPALKLFDSLCAESPALAVAHYGRARVLFELQRLDDALEAVETGLMAAPQDARGWTLKVRYLVCSGRIAEARAMIPELLELPRFSGPAPEWVAEALTMVGQHRAVRRLARGLFPEQRTAGLAHFLGVAWAHAGQPDRARTFFLRALRKAPDMLVASLNLVDLDRPAAQRNGAFGFTVDELLPRRVGSALDSAFRAGREREVTRALAKLAERCPQLLSLVPWLLRHGDPVGRTAAAVLSERFPTPESDQVALEVALSDRGSDLFRQDLCSRLAERGILLPDVYRLWIKGEWQDSVFMPISLDGPPPFRFQRRRAEQLYRQAGPPTKRGEYLQAEMLLRQALEEEPDSPHLMHYLAMNLLLQGDRQRAEQLFVRSHKTDPSYAASRLMLAKLRAEEGKVEEARVFLDPALRLRSIYPGELPTLMTALIAVLTAEGRGAHARLWLKMWRELQPNHPAQAEHLSLL